MWHTHLGPGRWVVGFFPLQYGQVIIHNPILSPWPPSPMWSNVFVIRKQRADRGGAVCGVCVKIAPTTTGRIMTASVTSTRRRAYYMAVLSISHLWWRAYLRLIAFTRACFLPVVTTALCYINVYVGLWIIYDRGRWDCICIMPTTTVPLSGCLCYFAFVHTWLIIHFFISVANGGVCGLNYLIYQLYTGMIGNWRLYLSRPRGP